MLEEIVLEVEDNPGALAEVGEVLGRAGVNIETVSAWSEGGRGFIHVVADDGDDAAETLKRHGYNIAQVRQVLTVTLDDRPGELGRYLRRLSEASVGVSAAYILRRGEGETEMIVAVDDVSTAQQV